MIILWEFNFYFIQADPVSSTAIWARLWYVSLYVFRSLSYYFWLTLRNWRRSEVSQSVWWLCYELEVSGPHSTFYLMGTLGSSSDRSFHLPIYLQLVLRMRMCGTAPSLLHMLLRQAQEVLNSNPRGNTGSLDISWFFFKPSFGKVPSVRS
jgi:hypothetical protein